MYLVFTRDSSFLGRCTARVCHIACVYDYRFSFVTVGAGLQYYHCITFAVLILLRHALYVRGCQNFGFGTCADVFGTHCTLMEK
jgi:hypothetical protein